MSWRETLGVAGSADDAYAHNAHYAQKATEPGHSADIADSAQVDLKSQKDLSTACYGLSITVKEFLALTNADDRALIQAGKFSPETLRAYAKSFAEGIASGRIVFYPTTG